jgi:hypothetical protein
MSTKHDNAIQVLREANAACQLNEDELAAAPAGREINLDGLDVVLKPTHPDGIARVWITVGDASVGIKTSFLDRWLTISVYVRGHEMEDPLEELAANLDEVTAQKAEWESNSEGTHGN